MTTDKPLPTPHSMPPLTEAMPPNAQTLVLGGGCFWCTEAVFLRVRGVLAVVSGYANGDAERFPQPSYEQVCTGQTGYNEVVQLVFDPALISTGELLVVFFGTHDPTTLNRQGHDQGTQYRSGIYTSTPAQHAEALSAKENLQASGQWPAPVVTEVEALRHFVPAEAYHQNYFAQHPHQGYCAMVVAPKVQSFMKYFNNLSK